MKKVIALISFLFFADLILCQEIHQAESFQLNSPVTGDQIYEASQYIKLLEPGFHYVPQPNESFTARINPFLVFPPTGGETGGPNPGDDGVVGTIGGELNINQMGSAYYSVPIDIPKGINNLQPNLSILYSSSLGDTYLGLGWSISGYSAISRIGCNIYNDNRITTPNFGNDDKFAIDGNRLMAVEGGTYGGPATKYKTEIEDFSIVITHKDEGNTSPDPDWFEVKTKNGQIMQYGKTSDSRIEPQGEVGKTQIWLLNEVKDLMGNFITYHYYEDNSTGEYYLESISYTGNNKITPIIPPFAEIVFQYENRPNTSIRYSNGFKTTISKLLEKIIVNYDNQMFKEYDLIYEYSNPNSLLTEIHLKSKENETINPLKFSYSQSFSTPVSEQTSLPLPDNHESSFADYNGDGLCDILYIEYPITPSSKWGLKINKNGTFDDTPDYSGIVPFACEAIYPNYVVMGQAQYVSPNNYGGNAPLPSLYISKVSLLSNLGNDFNGDGKSDIVIVTEYDEGNDHFYLYYTYYYDDLTNKIKQCNNVAPAIVRREHLNSKVFLADINGDMLTDFIIFDTDNTEEPIKTFTRDKDGALNVVSYANFCNWNIDSKVDFADFNGDGKADCMIRNPQGTQIFTFDNTSFEIFYTDFIPPSQFPPYNSKIYLGDFNGDGLTDVFEENLGYNPNGDLTYYYRLKNFNGKSFIDATFPLQPFDQGSTLPYSIFITDLNHDGKSDITLHLYHRLHLYISNGNDFFHDPDGYAVSSTFDIQHSYFGDFNGDGVLDIYQRSGNIIHLYKDDKSPLLNTITDSYGIKEKIFYDFLTNKNIYSRNPINSEIFGDYYTASKIPRVHYLQIAQPVVISVETENGFGTFNSKSFSYFGLSMHIAGKGFLGFRSVQTNDDITHAYNLTTSSVNNLSTNSTTQNYFISLPFNSENGFLINSKRKTNETFYTYKIHDQSDNRISPVLISTFSYNRTPDMILVNTTKSTNDYDENGYLYGNIPKITVLSDEEELPVNSPDNAFKYKSVTEFHYEPIDEPNWIISRIKSKNSKVSVPYQGSAEISRTTSYEYYLIGNAEYPLLRKTINFSGSKLLEEEYWYDAVGNIKKTKLSAPDCVDRFTRYEYNKTYDYRFLTKTKKMLVESDDPAIEKYLSNEIYYYPETGMPKETFDENGLKTTYFYDSYNRLQKKINPEGVIESSYLRWKTTQTDMPAGTLFFAWTCKSGSSPVITCFDKLGREFALLTKSFDNSTVVSKKTYDNIGRLEYIYEPNDNTKYTKNNFNPYGQLESVLYPDQTTETFTYSGRTNTSTKNTINPTQTQTQTKKVNALGWMEESIDANQHAVKYEYFSDGQVHRTYLDGVDGSAIVNTYDDITGKPSTTTDPDAGLIEYVYNAFGELVNQKQIQSATKTVEYTFKYDVLGRNTEKDNIEEGTTKTEYDTKPNGKGLMAKVENSTLGHSIEYEYDAMSRTIKQKEKIENVIYITSMGYDVYGHQNKCDYPYIEGTQPTLAVSWQYNYTGYLVSITNETEQKPIWQLTEMNIKGQMKKYILGNGLETRQEFYPLTGLPYTTKTFNSANRIQDLEYGWYETGNLQYRKKWLDQAHTSSLNEEFTYDNLNRLAITKLNGVQTSEMKYLPTGNIESKTGLGLYTYAENGAGIHAVTSVENTSGLLNQEQQSITYTPFNKVAHIGQGVGSYKTLDIKYGIDQQRIKQIIVQNGIASTKIYVGGMLERISGPELTIDNYFIEAPTGICAVYVKPPDGVAYTRYIHTDYLGSINCITNETGQLLYEHSFDAWGNHRNPLTWQATTSALPILFCDRGFTGHEHWETFSLINMNGRVYDPVLGRILSPDNYIQAPDFTQNLNRYSYCFNNPLKYTDPSGHIVGFIGGFIMNGMIGGTLNGIFTGINEQKRGDDFAYGFLKGFKSGFLSAGLAGGLNAGMSAYYSGANFWTGSKANNFVLPVFDNSNEPNNADPIDYSSIEGRRIWDKYHYNKGLKNIYTNGEGMTEELMKEKQVTWNVNKQSYFVDGESVGGFTDNIEFSKKSNVYISKSSFSSEWHLMVTMGHENIHVSDYFNQILIYGDINSWNASEARAYKYSCDQYLLRYHMIPSDAFSKFLEYYQYLPIPKKP
jgi:RHS repeat-associated protein